MNQQQVKVLYIGGYSRSGSTILLRLLGLLDGLFSVGELWDIWQRSFLENQLCGCGQPFRACDFWQAVIEDAYGGLEQIDVEEVQALRQVVQGPTGLLPLTIPSLRTPRYRQQLRDYQSILTKLYKAVQQTSGCEFIVDSSKVPTYAFLLNENPDIDLYVLHLVRDSRATTYSWQRKKHRPEIYWKRTYMSQYNPARSALEWNIMNGLFRFLERTEHNYKIVRYEDLTSRPYAAIVEIAGWLGVTRPEPNTFLNEHVVDLAVDHTVSGNPNRFQHGKVEIRPDIAWLTEMSRFNKGLVTALTWPILRHYGYFDKQVAGYANQPPVREESSPDIPQRSTLPIFNDGSTKKVGQPQSPPKLESKDESALPHKNSEPLRILLVTPRYLPYIGGTEIHTHEVARRLAHEGHEVTVLTTDRSRRLAATEESDGILIKRVTAWPGGRDYYFAPGIYKEIRQGQWDLIHCQGSHTFVAPLAMLAAYRSRIPYIVTFHSGGHSSRLRTALRPVQRALLRPLFARAKRLVGVSEWEVQFFHKQLGLPEEQFSLIPNGSYLPSPDEISEIPREETLIVSVGRLERYKGHHRIITALPEILKLYPNLRLRIVGSGPYEGNLRQLAVAYGVADRVEIRSVASSKRQEMAAVLLGAKLVILLSDYESQGIAVMEALALGRPVLVADTTALRELANRGLARATPLGCTPVETAQAIVGQLQNPLIPSDVTLPTWESCYEQLLTLYHSVVS